MKEETGACFPGKTVLGSRLDPTPLLQQCLHTLSVHLMSQRGGEANGDTRLSNHRQVSDEQIRKCCDPEGITHEDRD